MWIEAKTAEGLPYFFHSSTRETRWEQPAADSLEAAEAHKAEAPVDESDAGGAPTTTTTTEVKYGASKEEKDGALGELVTLLKELTTKRVRVQAVSQWFLSHDVAEHIAEACLKKMLDQVAVNLFSDEGPVLQRFKYSLAVLYAVDDIFKATKGDDPADARARASAVAFVAACERTKHLQKMIQRMAQFASEEEDDEPLLRSACVGTAKLVNIWAKRRSVSESAVSSLLKAAKPLGKGDVEAYDPTPAFRPDAGHESNDEPLVTRGHVFGKDHAVSFAMAPKQPPHSSAVLPLSCQTSRQTFSDKARK